MSDGLVWLVVGWVVGAAGVFGYRRRKEGPDAAYGLTRVAARGVSGVSLCAAAAVVVAMGLVARPVLIGLGPALAGPVFCTVTVVVLLIGELAVRPPTTARRSATLIPRRVADYVERRQLMAAGFTLAIASGFLAVAASLGEADDKGRPGRWLQISVPDERFVSRGWTVLWPGAYYALPLLAALAVSAVVSGLVLRSIARRPQPYAPAGICDGASGADRVVAEPVRQDEHARRRSVEIVLATVSLAAASTLCGPGSVAANGLVNALSGLSTGGGIRAALWGGTGVLLWAGVGLGATVAGWSLAVLIIPRAAHAAAARAVRIGH